MKKFRKKSHNAKKTEKENALGFFNIHSVAKHQRIEGGNFFSKKSLNAKKTGMVCYAEKEEKPFWFSSLGQMIQFGTIKVCRTFKNYFGQFVWIEKN